MIRRIRTRLGVGHTEDGLSLVELIVASMLTLLILAMVGAMFANTAQLTAKATQNHDSNTVAANVQSELRTVIGLAVQLPVSGSTNGLPPVSSGTNGKLVINSLINVTDPVNPAPTRVTFDSTSGDLVVTRCVGKSVSGFWTFTSCASSTTTDLGGVIIASSGSQAPLFSYLDANGSTIGLAAGALPPTSLPNVVSITVSINVRAPGSKTAPVYLSSNVGMPNIGLQKGTS